MPFSPDSQVISPASYVQDINPDILMKGAVYTQQNQEKNLQQIQDSYDQILNIPSFGKDREVLQQKAADLQDQVSQLSYSDLKNPQATSQLRNLIKQTVNDPDIQQIASRGYSYNQMLQEKKDYEKQGKQYLNPGLDALQSYYGGKDYIRNVNFQNDGFTPPDVAKMLKEAKDLVGQKKRRVQDSNGEYHIEKYTDPDDLKKAIETIRSSNPLYQKADEYNFNKANANVDWTQQGADILSSDAQNITRTIDLATKRMQLETNPARQKELQDQINGYLSDLDKTKKLADNPFYGQALRDQHLKNSIDHQNSQIAEALDNAQTGDIKQDGYIKDQQNHAYEINKLSQEYELKEHEDLYKEQLDEGTVDGVTGGGKHKEPKTPDEIAQKSAEVALAKTQIGAGDDNTNQVATNYIKANRQRLGLPGDKDSRYKVIGDGHSLTILDGDGNPIKGFIGVTSKELLSKVKDPTQSEAANVKNTSVGNSDYSNIKTVVNAKGDTIELGVKNGKWYNTKTNEEAK